MGQNSISSALDDIEFLVRSEHRVAALDALAADPKSRAELQAITGASTATVGRLLRAFEDRNWVQRDGHQYEATALGAFVAAGLQELLGRFERERTLRDIWDWIPPEASELALDLGDDAVVTVADVTDPYRPVNRFVALLRETDQFRFVGADQALLEPCKDELRSQILEGMQTEIIDLPDVARYILSTYAEHCAEPLESGNLTVRVHDEVPSYGICLFDRRIGVSCPNPDSGTVQVLIDTDAPSAREWAESTYAAYQRESRPLAHEVTA